MAKGSNEVFPGDCIWTWRPNTLIWPKSPLGFWNRSELEKVDTSSQMSYPFPFKDHCSCAWDSIAVVWKLTWVYWLHVGHQSCNAVNDILLRLLVAEELLLRLACPKLIMMIQHDGYRYPMVYMSFWHLLRAFSSWMIPSIGSWDVNISCLWIPAF